MSVIQAHNIFPVYLGCYFHVEARLQGRDKTGGSESIGHKNFEQDFGYCKAKPRKM